MSGALGGLSLGLGGGLIVLPFGSVPASGSLALNVAIPSLAPGDLAASIDVRVLAVPPAALRTLSNPATLTVLDSSL